MRRVEEVLVDAPAAKEEGVVVLGHHAVDEPRLLELRALRLRLLGRVDVRDAEEAEQLPRVLVRLVAHRLGVARVLALLLHQRGRLRLHALQLFTHQLNALGSIVLVFIAAVAAVAVVVVAIAIAIVTIVAASQSLLIHLVGLHLGFGLGLRSRLLLLLLFHLHPLILLQ